MTSYETIFLNMLTAITYKNYDSENDLTLLSKYGLLAYLG